MYVLYAAMHIEYYGNEHLAIAEVTFELVSSTFLKLFFFYCSLDVG